VHDAVVTLLHQPMTVFQSRAISRVDIMRNRQTDGQTDKLTYTRRMLYRFPLAGLYGRDQPKKQSASSIVNWLLVSV